jgi:hypothetical protein
VAAIEEDVQLGFITLIVAGVALVAYLVYDEINKAAVDPNTADPSSGLSNGILNALNNSVISENYPGGGEVSGSSETYSGAASTFLSDPWGSTKSILGIN